MANRLIALLAVLAALLFLPAGRWNWPEAWALLLAYGAFLALYAVWGLWMDPAQLKERSRLAPNVKTWDKMILTAYTLCLLLTFVLAGLDAGRIHWSSVPLSTKALAWLGQALAGGAIFWAVATNTYLSRLARIQDDRGQVLLFVCVPLALGSWWASRIPS
jgi:hypothetical protein